MQFLWHHKMYGSKITFLLNDCSTKETGWRLLTSSLWLESNMSKSWVLGHEDFEDVKSTAFPAPIKTCCIFLLALLNTQSLLAIRISHSWSATNFPKVSIESSFFSDFHFASSDICTIVFEAYAVFLFLHFGPCELVHIGTVGVVSAFELVVLQSVTSSTYRTCEQRTKLLYISLFLITIIRNYK